MYNKQHTMLFSKIRLIVFILSYSLFSSFALAQSNCEQNLKQADELYNAGDYDNCISILESSLKKCGFSKKKKEFAFELLTKAYLEQDNLQKANQSVVGLLKNNPYYETKENAEHEDFEILVEKFDALPVLSVGLRNTVMKPSFKTTKINSVLESIDYGAAYQTNRTVLLYYGIAEYGFKKEYSVNVDFINYKISLNRTLTNSKTIALSYLENSSFIEIPVYFKKYFFIGKNVSLYSALGAGYLRTTKANATLGISYLSEDIYTGAQSEYTSVESFDVLTQKSRNSYEWLAGVGGGFRFRGLGIYIDARYTGGLSSLNNSANRFQNSTIVTDYFYVDNAVKMNKYELGLSISYTLKNVVKKVR
jgi:hypothetical protein